MHLYTLSGELIYSYKLDASNTKNFPVQLREGIYIIKAEAENWTDAQKIIVK
jgi:hypothetical protein